MGRFDAPGNPSAGKFEAPDPARFDPPQPMRPRVWLFPALILLIYLLKFELHSVRGSGWIAAAAAAGFVALTVAEFFVGRKRREALNEKDDPYTEQQRVTR